MQRPGVNLPSDNSSGESVGSPAPEYGTKNYLDTSMCEKDQLPKSRSGSTKAQNIFCGGDARFITQQGGSRKIFGYPIHLFLMLLIEFCERFCYYGVRSVLLTYFTSELINFDQSNGSSVYHFYIMLCYTAPLIGGYVADQYWGRFRTILYLSLVYILGNSLLTFASWYGLEDPNADRTRTLSIISLCLIAFGTGGIKPCMAAFCGDQFSEEEKEKREKFFSLFYLFINVGAIGSSYSTPYLKSISKDTYWISFIVPSALMIVAVVVYIASSMNFTIVPPSGEMLPIIKAMGGCSRSAKAKYAASRARKLTVLVLPTIAFWMVFDLAGSLFTIQAGMLNRVIKLPFIGEYWLKTGSCETMNPIILVVILIPLFMYVIYPVIAKFFNFTSERKMAVGMVFLLIQCWYLSVTQKSIDEHTTYVLPEYMYEGQALGNFSGNTFAFNIYCNNEVKPCPEMKQKGTHKFHPYDDEEYNNLMGYDEQKARKREHYQTYLPNGPKATKTSVRYWSSDCPKEGCMLKKEQDTTGDAKAGLVFNHGSKDNTIEINMKRGNLNKIFRLDDHWFTTYPTLIKYEQFLGRNTLTAYKLGEIKDEYICENVDEVSNWYRGIVWKNATEVSSKVREALGLSTLNVKRMNYTEATITDGSYKPAFFDYQVAIEEMETNGIVERLTKEKLTSGLHVRTYIVAPDLKCRFKDSQRAHKFGVQGRYSLMIESSSEDHQTFITDISGTENMHIWRQAVMYALASTGEVLISIVGLEYCYSEAPLKLRSTMAAIWFLMVGIANVPPMFITKKEYFPGLNSHSLKMYQLAIYLSMAAIPCMIATGYFYTPKRDEKESEKEEVSLNDVDDGKTKL